jgi:hypothetical protein
MADFLGTWGKRTQDWLGGARRSLLGEDLPPAEKRAATVGTMGPGIATQMQGLDTAQRAALKRGGVRDLLGDPDVQARATDVASNLDFTGTFGGVHSGKAPMHDFGKATEMRAAGRPAEEIWKETGWFKGVDDKWRWEIDDSRSMLYFGKIKEIAETDLLSNAGTVLRHPDLYAAYPNLEKAQVGVDVPQGTYGQWKGYGLDIAPNLRPSEQKSTMLHELQHGVQDKEGFAKGGSPESAASQFYDDTNKRLSEIVRQKDRATGAEKAALQAEYDRLMEAKMAAKPFDLYRRLAGETEARAVQARAYLTPDERRARAPWLDYDIPPEQQIVRGVR